jgi:predicted ATPase
MWFLVDQRVVARAMLARVLLLRGQIDQARQNAQISLEEALATDDKLSICYALRNAVCPIALTVGDMAAAEESVALLTRQVTRQGMTFWMSWGSCLEGQLLVRRGAFEKGIPLLRAGIEMRARAGWLMRNPEFLGVLAEGLAAAGQADEAQVAINEALSQAEGGGQLWCLAELLRVKGELLLQSGRVPLAERAFCDGIDVARRQDALFWQLRVALSLARLRVSQGQPETAREVLAPVYDQFMEGFETPYLHAAKTLLDGLRSRRDLR